MPRAYFQSGFSIGRLGGEEFCIASEQVSPENAVEILEGFRRLVETTPAEGPDGHISFTISIGVVTDVDTSFSQMLKKLDKCSQVVEVRRQVRGWVNTA